MGMTEMQENLSNVRTQSALVCELQEDLLACQGGFVNASSYESWGSKITACRSSGHYMQRSFSPTRASYRTGKKQQMIDSSRSLRKANTTSTIAETAPTMSAIPEQVSLSSSPRQSRSWFAAVFGSSK